MISSLFNSAAIAKATAAASQTKLSLYIQYASIVLIWYDYMLTFPREVRYVWQSKLRVSSVLYVFTRYALVGNVLYLFAITHKLPNCNAWYKFIGVLSVFGRASVLAIFTFRTSAVYGQNKIITAVLGTVAATCVALDISHLPGLRCVGSTSNPIVADLLSVMVCVFELLSSGLILLRAAIVWKARGRIHDGSLVGFILEQGLLYFGGVFAFQFTAVLLNFLTKQQGIFPKLINALTLPVGCLLTARFVLGLREWDAAHTSLRARSSEGSASQRESAMPAFASAVGSALADDFGSPETVFASLGAGSREWDEEAGVGKGVLEKEARGSDVEVRLDEGREGSDVHHDVISSGE